MLDRVACEPPYKNPKISPQMFRTKIVHTSGKMFDFGGSIFSTFWGSRNIFNPCSHIEFNTQNPNPISKIAISFTKTPKKPKHFRKKRTLLGHFKNRKFSQKCEQFSYETFGGIFWDFCKEVHTRPGPTCAPYIYIYIYIYVYIYIKKKEIYIQDAHVGPVACELV